jgi:opacity protein-like surface antigen
MEALVAIVVVLAVAGAAAVVLRQQRKPRAELPPARTPADDQRALHGDVRSLKPGDVVAYEGVDYIVDRSMRFDEDGFTWDEHLLSDSGASGRSLWLSVEDDEGVEVAIYEKVAGVDVSPGPAQVEHGGVTYGREEQGRASFRVERAGGAPGEAGTMEYADYRAGEQLLAFERYGTGGWEVSTGRTISEHVLDIYPRGA